MKKKLVLFVTVISLVSCSEKEIDMANLVERNDKVYEVNSEKPFSGKITKKNEKGQFIITGHYNKGLKDDEWVYYYNNGQVKKKVHYKNNVLNGKYETYTENGDPLISTNYLKGKYDGNYIEYNNRKNLIRDINYKNGQYNGNYKEYNSNGILIIETTYKNGLIDGKYKDYYKNGNIHYSYSMKNNDYEGDYIEYNSDKTIKKHLFYENGSKINKGTWTKYWNENNQIVNSPSVLFSKVSFDKNGKPSTKVKFYYQKSGKIRSELSFESVEPDLIDGECVYYSENGNVSMKGQYKNNKREGEWVSYYDKKNVIGTFVKEKVIYKNGLLDGSYTYYYNSNYYTSGPTTPVFVKYKPQTDYGYWKLEGYLSKGKLDKTWKLWLMYRKYNNSNSCWYKMNVYSTTKWDMGREVENSYLSLQSNKVYDSNNNRLNVHWMNLSKEVIKINKPLYCR